MSKLWHAVRSILHRPAFAVTALLTIVLGIGANTAVYAVIHSVLLQPLPFHDPNALVQVWETHPELHNLQVSVPDYLDWKKSIKSLDLAAYTFQAINKVTLLGQGDPLEVQATDASFQLFGIVGIEPLLGHAYTTQQEQRKERVALISETLWRRKFSSDPGIIGRPLRLETISFTIIGVVRQRQAFPVWADVWMPLSLIEPELESTRQYHPLEVIGRLKGGVPLARAESEIETVARRLSAAYPATNGKIGAFVIPLMTAVTGDVRPALLAVWMAVGLVLLIASVNLAHLMMARSLSHRRDIAIRLALGASRWAAVQEFFLETAILSLVGGILGMLSAAATLPLLRNLAQGRIPRLESASLDGSVLLFGLLLSFVVALLSAMPAFWEIALSDLNEWISSSGERLSARQSWLSPLLLGSEVAVALAVLLTATMLVRSFALTLDTNPGFQPDHVLAVNAPLAREWDKSYELFRNRVVPELMRIPGVQDVAAVNSVPMSLGPTEQTRYATRFGVVGRAFDPGQFPTAQIRWCSSNYFGILGIPLESGRFLTERDHGQPRYLVNEVFARRFFPNGNAVGQKLILGVVTPHPERGEIVGVVGNIHEFGLSTPPEPTMYSLDVSPRMDILIKASGRAKSVVSSVTIAMRHVEPEAAIGPVRSLNDYISTSLAQQRFALLLMTAFAGLAMVLCAVGIYGVFGCSVTRRLREFGIRSAIGARQIDLLALILRECLLIVVPGLIAGLIISAGSSQLIRALLYRISSTDALSYLIAAASILFLCLASAVIPAMRAAKVDPLHVLREQ